jgi:hypothetical protein
MPHILWKWKAHNEGRKRPPFFPYQPRTYSSWCPTLFIFKSISILRFPLRLVYAFWPVHKTCSAAVLSHVCCVTGPSHIPWFYGLSNASRLVEIFSFLLCTFPSLVSLRPKYKCCCQDTVQTHSACKLHITLTLMDTVKWILLRIRKKKVPCSSVFSSLEMSVTFP